MGWRLRVFATLCVLSLGPAVEGASGSPVSLHLLYVGSAKSSRGEAFAAFLKRHFAGAKVADRQGFDPAAARDADVVLFDWSQSDGDLAKTPVPLGRFEDWSKPTVLLNSAGLLVAGRWQVIGGAG